MSDEREHLELCLMRSWNERMQQDHEIATYRVRQETMLNHVWILIQAKFQDVSDVDETTLARVDLPTIERIAAILVKYSNSTSDSAEHDTCLALQKEFYNVPQIARRILKLCDALKLGPRSEYIATDEDWIEWMHDM